MNRREISERLLEAYKASGYSYAELSQKTGIHKSVIHRYLTGDVERIPIERLDAICNVLGLDVNELLGWNEPHDGKIRRTITPQQSCLLDASEDLTDREREMVLKMIESIKEYRGNSGT